MNFLSMQQELAERLRAYDETISADATKLKRWLNIAQREISSEWNWPFLQDVYILQTVADITTGTVTATNASTSITFSSAPTPSVSGRFIQFSDTDDWYEITSHTAASTSATLGQNFLGTTSSTLTYTVRQFFYSLPSTFDRTMVVAQAISSRKLVGLRHQEFDRNLIFNTATGTPEAYYMFRQDSSFTWQIGLYPTPNATINIWIKYLKRVTDLSADGDTSIIGSNYDSCILDLASFYGFATLDDNRSKMFYEKYQLGLERMKKTCKPDLGTLNVMRAVDDMSPHDSLSFRLPPEFGPIVG